MDVDPEVQGLPCLIATHDRKVQADARGQATAVGE
jgi:hypothetical protein